MVDCPEGQPPPLPVGNPATDSAEQEPASGRKTAPKRLTYGNVAGSEGNKRKIKIATQCLMYKSNLFGTGKKRDYYMMIATDLNKAHPELFHGLLKESAVADVWNSAQKDAVAQQADKVEKHHLWYNGSKLREMSDWETLLDEIWVEKKASEEKAQAEKGREEGAERDKQEKLPSVFDWVDKRYLDGARRMGRRSDSCDEGDEPNTPGSNSDKGSAEKEKRGAAYGKGQKGGLGESAAGNPGLKLDPQPDKLSDACQKLAELSSSVAEVARKLLDRDRNRNRNRNRDRNRDSDDSDSGSNRSGKRCRVMTEKEKEEIEVKKTEAQAKKMEATSKLMETYLKFVQSGVELPAKLKKMVEEEGKE